MDFFMDLRKSKFFPLTTINNEYKKSNEQISFRGGYASFLSYRYSSGLTSKNSKSDLKDLKNSKMNDIVQKGEVPNFECLNKCDILLGERVGQN